MKVLVIDYDAGTPFFGGDTHAFDLANEWKKSGGKSLIVAADYSYLRKRRWQSDGLMNKRAVHSYGSKCRLSPIERKKFYEEPCHLRRESAVTWK